jgi:hypothetical protein
MNLRSQLRPLAPFLGPLAAAWLGSAAIIGLQLF